MKNILSMDLKSRLIYFGRGGLIIGIIFGIFALTTSLFNSDSPTVILKTFELTGIWASLFVLIYLPIVFLCLGLVLGLISHPMYLVIKRLFERT